MGTRILVLAISVLLIGQWAACGGEQADQQDKENGQAAGMEASQKEGTVVVTVNGKEITGPEVEKELALMMMQMAGRVDPSRMEGMKENMRKQTVNNMINQELLLQAATREGISVTDEEKTEKIEELKASYPSEEAFLNGLKQSNMTVDILRDRIGVIIKIEKLADKQTEHLQKVTAEDTEEYYNNNIEQFQQPEKVSASHILVAFKPGDDEAAKIAKKQKIEQIHLAILGGADFVEQARQHSDCPSKSNGGSLGSFGKGQMVKPFEDVVFALKPNEVSGIFETRYGYHIARLTGREEAKTMSLEEARENIANYLESDRKQQEMSKYIAALRDVANIEYSDSSLAGP